MKELYTKMYGVQLFRILADNVNDLHTWDVYNKDLLNEELAQLDELMEVMKKKINKKALSK